VWSPSRGAKERIAKRSSGVRARVDQWPLVGASVALLLIIIVSQGTLSQVCHMAIADLPLTAYATPQPKAMRENAIKIVISRDGSVYFRNQRTDSEALRELIRKAVEDGAERKVYLTVDGRAKYGDAKVVYDAIAAGGVRDICLMAEKIDPHR